MQPSTRQSFFSTVRAIEQNILHAEKVYAHQKKQRVGYDGNPKNESIRFKGTPSVAFSAHDAFKSNKLSDTDKQQIRVAFFSLFGTHGALPQHYTELLLSRLKQKDATMADFLDLFNHRLISLFYRAWEKHQLPVDYERHIRKEENVGSTIQALFGLTGAYQAETQSTVAYFGGYFSKYPRNAASLANMLSEIIGEPVEIKQFSGKWVNLSVDDCSALPTKRRPKGKYATLGRDAMMGKRVWQPSDSFSVVIGPVPRNKFELIRPGQSLYNRIVALSKEYAGPSLRFDIEVVVRPEAIGSTRLSADARSAKQLSRNAWLGNPNNFKSNKSIVFRPENHKKVMS